MGAVEHSFWASLKKALLSLRISQVGRQTVGEESRLKLLPIQIYLLAATNWSSSPSRIRFDPDLESPAGRSRRASLPYPKVAQSKGSSDRKFSYDLFWKLHTLSAVLDVVPIDCTEGPESAPESPSLKPSSTRKSSHSGRRRGNWVVLSRKETYALLNDEVEWPANLTREMLNGGWPLEESRST
ncbi:hypothetical protein B0H10DRAFT_2188166 [Mycena sp. CBHHK59/15]|nr:hypothetical protein B0H10DRAFT_2188166 [Mycena sp. CBHHK59/15]